jgi:nucleoside-diphosphate kinase
MLGALTRTGNTPNEAMGGDVAVERTLVIVKPDGVQRGLVGEIVGRLERRGLKIVAMRLRQIEREVAERHYGEHVGKPFYAGLVDYITSSPVVTMVLEGPNAVAVVRSTMGATNPANAAPGTIRADLALEIGRNLIHGSDGPESAEREIALFFGEDGVVPYRREVDRWVVEDAG